MASGSPTFVLKNIDAFELKVELSIPPERPVMKGYILVDAYVRTKDEIKALADEDLTDSEYFDRLVKGVRGLGNDAGALLEGDEAMKEATTGRMSMYLVPAIVGAYFEQYGEARRKNSKKSQSR